MQQQKDNIIVGIDIGSKKICTIVGVMQANSGIEIIGLGNSSSQGLKKGSVINIEQVSKAISDSINEAKLMSGVDIKRAIVGVAGTHIKSFNSSGMIPINGKEVTNEDINMVINTARAIVIPSDREILHIIPQEYIIDNISGIKNPIGMSGVRLEVKVHVITGLVSLLKNLEKSVKQCGVDIEAFSLQSIVSSDAVLSDEEKEMGVVLVDIGGGTTDLVFWKGGSIISSQIIPVGGDSFTNDLSVALKVSYAEAESIKVNYGNVLRGKINQEENITVDGVGGARKKEISLNYVSDILNSRAEELLELIKDFIDNNDIRNELNGGVVLTGGVSLLQGLLEIGEYIIEQPVRIGHPIPFTGMAKLMKDPRYATALGLLIEQRKRDKNLIKSSDIDNIKVDFLTKFNNFKTAIKEIF